MAGRSKQNIARNMRDIRSRLGLSMEAMAHVLGFKGASGYQRYEDEGLAPEYLKPDLYNALARRALGNGKPPLTLDDLRPLSRYALPVGPARVSLSKGDLGPSLEGEPVPMDNLFGRPDLPILGHARGGAEGYFFDNGQPVARTHRPPELMGVSEGYAVYVNGDSMAPRYRHGEMIYVDPVRPPRPGNDVVIQMTDGQGLVKELVRRTKTAVTILQHNPPGEYDLPADQVRAIHLIVGSSSVR